MGVSETSTSLLLHVLVSLLRWGWLSSWPHSVRGIDSTEGNQLRDVHMLGGGGGGGGR